MRHEPLTTLFMTCDVGTRLRAHGVPCSQATARLVATMLPAAAHDPGSIGECS
jgi:hypothetical protein